MKKIFLVLIVIFIFGCGKHAYQHEYEIIKSSFKEFETTKEAGAGFFIITGYWRDKKNIIHKKYYMYLKDEFGYIQKLEIDADRAIFFVEDDERAFSCEVRHQLNMTNSEPMKLSEYTIIKLIIYIKKDMIIPVYDFGFKDN